MFSPRRVIDPESQRGSRVRLSARQPHFQISGLHGAEGIHHARLNRSVPLINFFLHFFGAFISDVNKILDILVSGVRRVFQCLLAVAVFCLQSTLVRVFVARNLFEISGRQVVFPVAILLIALQIQTLLVLLCRILIVSQLLVKRLRFVIVLP